MVAQLQIPELKNQHKNVISELEQTVEQLETTKRESERMIQLKTAAVVEMEAGKEHKTQIEKVAQAQKTVVTSLKASSLEAIRAKAAATTKIAELENKVAELQAALNGHSAELGQEELTDAVAQDWWKIKQQAASLAAMSSEERATALATMSATDREAVLGQML